MIPSVRISQIISDIFDSHPLYIAPDIRKLLRITSKRSFYETFSSLLRRSIREFELKVPLYMSNRTILVTGPTNLSGYTSYEFYDNYNGFLSGALTEDQLELIPTTITSFGRGLLAQPRRVSYNAPVLQLRQSGRVILNYLTKYPYRFTKDRSEDEFSAESHIFGIGEMSGGKYTFLLEMIEYNVCMFLRDQKAQINFNELPLEILNSIETRISELETRIQDFYSNAVWYSSLMQ